MLRLTLPAESANGTLNCLVHTGIGLPLCLAIFIAGNDSYLETEKKINITEPTSEIERVWSPHQTSQRYNNGRT